MARSQFAKEKITVPHPETYRPGSGSIDLKSGIDADLLIKKQEASLWVEPGMNQTNYWLLNSIPDGYPSCTEASLQLEEVPEVSLLTVSIPWDSESDCADAHPPCDSG
ncbi:uncharacterized protein ARMOST_04485 [Armillaria ostoyae]|uniref:Uncharacterized protein n=1 Tax=Armillaria ostoyae TaxID=47428 RepID=A0A284QXH7_ARMOS|nr:uncharacterized protein ARMOST_04485 [Armillaria ostoyae]